MASRAISAGQRAAKPDWRAVLRRSVRRAGELGGAIVLFAAMAFLVLALATYSQTDPSASTAAGGEVRNWMGPVGAFVADQFLFYFGPVAWLFVPLLYVFARKLWLLVEEEDAEAEPSDQRWWKPVAMLVLAMILITTVLSLWFNEPGGTLPASMGGITGLLGAYLINTLAGLAPAAVAGWIKLAVALVLLGLGVTLVGRVFALDWARLLTLPGRIGRLPAALPSPGMLARTGKEKARAKARPRAGESPDTADDLPFEIDAPVASRGEGRKGPAPLSDKPRKAPAIVDSQRAAKPAQIGAGSSQADLFDQYKLPSLDLLADPPAGSGKEIDKLSLERNARLLETVLDDFNVKGEITAVRTGPVVTMYELEPAPGIKASRVIGLADDIARNMSAISARVSSIPGRTVMGIELPNAERQMVSYKEMVASEAFAHHKGMLPIILGKDIAGEPVVADLATMPHLLVAGTTGSGKSVGLNAILLSLLYRLTPAQCRLILVDPKVLELKSYDDIPHLLSPVVTEPPKAVRALKWAVEEMERRYRMMSEVSVRNLAGFNDKVRKAAAKGEPLGRRVQTGFDAETGEALYEENQLDYEVLPQIVLIVDELADLMVTVGKEIEVLIQRLAQKSRAAGIPPHHGHAAPLGRRHYRRHQGQPANAHLVRRHQPHRQPHDPGRTGRRAAAGQGRHALQAEHRPGEARPRPLRFGRGSRARRRLLALSGQARIRRCRHRGARGRQLRLRRPRRHRLGPARGAQVPPGLPARLREPEGFGLLAPAPDGRGVQHRGQMGRAHGTGRLRRARQPCRTPRYLPRRERQPALGHRQSFLTGAFSPRQAALPLDGRPAALSAW